MTTHTDLAALRREQALFDTIRKFGYTTSGQTLEIVAAITALESQPDAAQVVADRWRWSGKDFNYAVCKYDGESWVPISSDAEAADLLAATPKPQEQAAQVVAGTGGEPFAYYVYFPSEQRGELVHDLDELLEDMTNLEHEVTPLHAPTEATTPQPASEPVAWQFRWTNPGANTFAQPDELAWKTLEPRGGETMAERVAEITHYTYDGKPCYEVRALGVLATPQPAAKPAQADALNTLCKMLHNGEEVEGDDGLAMLVPMDLWNEAQEAIELLVGEDDDEAAQAEPGARDGWLRDGSLLYRLTDERHPTNRDEINVTMVDGSRDLEKRSERAAEPAETSANLGKKGMRNERSNH